MGVAYSCRPLKLSNAYSSLFASPPAGFEWCTVDIRDEEELKEMYQLLCENYVEVGLFYNYNYRITTDTLVLVDQTTLASTSLETRNLNADVLSASRSAGRRQHVPLQLRAGVPAVVRISVCVLYVD